jgi:carboxypeptidase C (cathepsin A)
MFREFDELPWSKNMQFRLQPRANWAWTGAAGGSPHKGGLMKGLRELTIAGINDAGHMSPGDQKQPVSLLVQRWIDD